MKFKPLPSFEVVDELLHYDQQTGDLTWKKSTCNRNSVGSIAGSTHSSGYRFISINYQSYKAHRLAWLLATGQDPDSMTVDHKNRDRSDNRFSNLRLATSSQQLENQVSNGCDYNRQKCKWRARINDIFLGYFDSRHEARQAYLEAKQELHGEFCPTNNWLCLSHP